jgi:hypothetical protein
MSDKLPMVRKLQAEALSSDSSVANMLRMAKVLATKLDLPDALLWINRELNGYQDALIKDLPPYRKLNGVPQAHNPYHGWQSIRFHNAKQAEFLSTVPVCHAIGSLEELLRKGADGNYTFNYPPELKTKVEQSLNHQLEVRVNVGYAGLWNIIEQVRNLILNWSLELESAGILGVDMTFTEEEKGEASAITHQFIIQNVGVLGNVTGQATVKNRQDAIANLELDLAKVLDFVAQARIALPSMPDTARDAAKPVLEGLEGQLRADKPDTSKIRELLASLRKICEGATGSLTAQGIVAMVRALLGA